jgi:hypothetical protein
MGNASIAGAKSAVAVGQRKMRARLLASLASGKMYRSRLFLSCSLLAEVGGI